MKKQKPAKLNDREYINFVRKSLNDPDYPYYKCFDFDFVSFVKDKPLMRKEK